MHKKDETGILIGKNIRRLMDSRQISRQHLADLLGVSVTSVGFWCSGDRIPRIDKIDKMCAIFNCTRSSILEGSAEQNGGEDMTVAFLQDAELLSALSIYFRLPDEKKRHVIEMIRLLGEDQRR